MKRKGSICISYFAAAAVIAAVTFAAVFQFVSFTPQAGLVFCPLDKKWVRQNPPTLPQKDPLTEICSSGKNKSEFEAHLFGGIHSLVPQKDVAALFFAFTKERAKAFQRLGTLPGGPERNASINAGERAATGGYSRKFVPSAAVITAAAPLPELSFSTTQLPHYESEPVRANITNGRPLLPRAPPADLRTI